MKIPAKKIVNALQSKAGRNNSNDEVRILWNVLLNVDGPIDMDVDDLISMFYDTQSDLIVGLVEQYGSSMEITKFLANTKGLISDKTYQLLQQTKQNKIDKEIDWAIKQSKDRNFNA